MRKLFLLVAAIASITSCATPNATIPSSTPTNTAPVSTNSDQTLANAFQNRTSDLQVQGSGTVSRILADDNDGSRHQKFILQLNSGQTILVAHNIDLAPRIDALKTGDTVDFYGEYEWNEKGGVIHWTHHDPAGKHVGGWLSHNGKRYE
ncbi:MAG: DUF3465 domain-containing protein [Limnothrix sp. RL_2_0]|nr:DUF3465 domain-containing protein [Limnothrix sp. RL_2_0]